MKLKWMDFFVKGMKTPQENKKMLISHKNIVRKEVNAPFPQILQNPSLFVSFNSTMLIAQ